MRKEQDGGAEGLRSVVASVGHAASPKPRAPALEHAGARETMGGGSLHALDEAAVAGVDLQHVADLHEGGHLDGGAGFQRGGLGGRCV